MNYSIPSRLAFGLGLLVSVAAHAETTTTTQAVGASGSLEARVAALSASNAALTAQVKQLQQEIADYKAQDDSAVLDENIVYVTSKADKRYENWYGLSIGDTWRLREDTPVKLIEPHDNKLAYSIMPAGTVVTIIGAPRGITGTYVVATGNNTTGWANLR